MFHRQAQGVQGILRASSGTKWREVACRSLAQALRSGWRTCNSKQCQQ